MAEFSTETSMATAAEQAELASETETWVEEFKGKNASEFFDHSSAHRLVTLIMQDARWDWCNDEEKSPWKVASHWQAFHRKWRASGEVIQPGTILDAGIPSKERALQTKDKKIYVRQSYVETLRRVWRAAASKFGGILIAGQPGIGASSAFLPSPTLCC